MASAISAAFHITFFGTQPTLTQVPPSRAGSNTATRAPYSTARCAAGQVRRYRRPDDEIERLHSSLLDRSNSGSRRVRMALGASPGQIRPFEFPRRTHSRLTERASMSRIIPADSRRQPADRIRPAAGVHRHRARARRARGARTCSPSSAQRSEPPRKSRRPTRLAARPRANQAPRSPRLGPGLALELGALEPAVTRRV